MKKLLSGIALLTMLLVMLPSAAFAEDDSRSYEFDLTTNGKYEISASAGDIITLILHLKRTDAAEAAPIYAMQDEIYYDSTFFEPVEGGSIAAAGIETTDLAMRDNYRACYMNFVDFGGGANWEADTMIGTFQLRVIATGGSSVIENRNYKVSTSDGSDSFSAVARDVTVVVSTDCIVHFESNGGSAVPDQTVAYGERLKEPETPTRDGYTFAGWYKDLDLEEAWHFDGDLVTGNMTLYAGWAEGQPASPESFEFPWLMLLLIALVAAAAILLVLLLYKKKKDEEEEKERAQEKATHKDNHRTHNNANKMNKNK